MFGMVFGLITDDIVVGWFENGLLDDCYIAIEGDAHNSSHDGEVDAFRFQTFSAGCEQWTYCITQNNYCNYLETVCRRYYDTIIQATDCVYLKENSSVISNIQSQITSEIDRATTVETDLQSQINDLYDIINDDTGDTDGDGYDDVCYEAGADSGDANGDGTLDVLDIVYFLEEILDP